MTDTSGMESFLCGVERKPSNGKETETKGFVVGRIQDRALRETHTLSDWHASDTHIADWQSALARGRQRESAAAATLCCKAAWPQLKRFVLVLALGTHRHQHHLRRDYLSTRVATSRRDEQEVGGDKDFTDPNEGKKQQPRRNT